jgi:hypothetical protein
MRGHAHFLPFSGSTSLSIGVRRGWAIHPIQVGVVTALFGEPDHSRYAVGDIIMPALRMIDRITAAARCPPLQTAQLADQPLIIK